MEHAAISALRVWAQNQPSGSARALDPEMLSSISVPSAKTRMLVRLSKSEA